MESGVEWKVSPVWMNQEGPTTCEWHTQESRRWKPQRWPNRLPEPKAGRWHPRNWLVWTRWPLKPRWPATRKHFFSVFSRRVDTSPRWLNVSIPWSVCKLTRISAGERSSQQNLKTMFGLLPFISFRWSESLFTPAGWMDAEIVGLFWQALIVGEYRQIRSHPRNLTIKPAHRCHFNKGHDYNRYDGSVMFHQLENINSHLNKKVLFSLTYFVRWISYFGNDIFDKYVAYL